MALLYNPLWMIDCHPAGRSVILSRDDMSSLNYDALTLFAACALFAGCMSNALAESKNPVSELESAWPALPGWRSETIPFPLDFAPGLKHQGVEEIRFSPGFSKPGDQQFFSYAFIWLIPATESIDAANLKS